MLKLIAALSISIAFSASANNEINYTELEQKSSDIICKVNSECVPFKALASASFSGAFVVDGITLPSDALQDKEQQADMLAASLYITKDGGVMPLPEQSDITEESEQELLAYKKREAVLPIKMFPAPIISSSSDKVIIKVQ